MRKLFHVELLLLQVIGHCKVSFSFAEKDAGKKTDCLAA